MSADSTFSSDWKSSQRQREMINDKVEKLSKKEAGLLIKIIQAIFDDRVTNRL